MTAIGSISSVVAGAHTPYAPSPTDKGQGSLSSSSADPFNYQDQVDLSDSAKHAVQGANQANATNPHATPNSLTDKVAEAKRQVQGLVGIDGVSDVVDGFGNIDTAKLAELEAKQALTDTPASTANTLFPATVTVS